MGYALEEEALEIPIPYGAVPGSTTEHEDSLQHTRVL